MELSKYHYRVGMAGLKGTKWENCLQFWFKFRLAHFIFLLGRPFIIDYLVHIHYFKDLLNNSSSEIKIQRHSKLWILITYFCRRHKLGLFARLPLLQNRDIYMILLLFQWWYESSAYCIFPDPKSWSIIEIWT